MATTASSTKLLIVNTATIIIFKDLNHTIACLQPTLPLETLIKLQIPSQSTVTQQRLKVIPPDN